MLKTIVKTQMLINDFQKNIEGASLIEYSILIGLIAAAVVAVIGFVGDKIGISWNNLNGAFNPTAAATTP